MKSRWPTPGEQLPRWGHPWLAAASRGLLRLLGWRIEGEVPNERKLLLTLVPHTSNWDWVLGMLVIAGLDLEIHWIGKTSLFRGPWGRAFRAIGGIPVDPDSSTVEQVVEAFRTREKCLIAIAPEGQRQPVAHFRSGFYHMAHRADVPILPIYLDWERRVLGVMEPLQTTGDAESEIRDLERRYEPWRTTCSE